MHCPWWFEGLNSDWCWLFRTCFLVIHYLGTEAIRMASLYFSIQIIRFFIYRFGDTLSFGAKFWGNGINLLFCTQSCVVFGPPLFMARNLFSSKSLQWRVSPWECVEGGAQCSRCTMGFDADITEQSGSGAQWVKWCRAAGLLLYQLRREISSGDDTRLSAASVACHGD